MYEYQVKKMLHTYNIPIPRGYVTHTPEQCLRAAESMGWHCVIKNIRWEETEEVMRHDCPGQMITMMNELFGEHPGISHMNQERFKDRWLLVEESVNIDRKLYLSVSTDPSSSNYCLLASAAGKDGSYNSSSRLRINPFKGLHTLEAYDFALRLGLNGHLCEEYAALILNMYRLCLDKECSLVEIDPLVITHEGWLVALEARIFIDENAIYSMPAHRN